MKLKVSLFYLIFYLAEGAFMPFTSLFLHQKGYDGGQIGVVLAIISLAGIIGQPIFGAINDSAKDYRTVLKVTTFLSALVSFGFFLKQYFVLTLIIASLFSFIVSPIGPIMDSISVEKGPQFAFSYGQVRLWGAFGFAIITAIVGYVYSNVGYQYSFTIYAAFSILVFILMFIFPKFEAPKRRSAFGKESLSEVLTNRSLALFILISILISSIVNINFSYLPIYFQKMHYPINLVGWNFTVAACIEIPLFWLSAKVREKMGLFSMLLTGTLAYSLKYLFMGFAPPVGIVICLQTLDGLAFAFYYSAAVEIISQMAPKRAKSTSQALFGAASGLAGIIGNLVGGLIIENQGAQFLYWVMSAVGLLATFLFLLFSRKSMYRLEFETEARNQA
ncbi:MFS transporter [Pullulanibacillus sp. KACC 23026]|uniref:MFS transporter n=1 Tax=Pullulanibacillus sp. KACC 23026 TaxID=3028315 RepID=UPI0023AF0072|nr:MFS transporter [Pullulanibacillus sp. KACC 23026]WEG10772.1 MFS transporter [Pullulanibacillus sp. KACC 23026]